MGCGASRVNPGPGGKPSEPPVSNPAATSTKAKGPQQVPAEGGLREMSRFFETRSQHTYYTLKDSKTIKDSLTISIGNDYYSIFFPIGFNGVNIKAVLTDDKLASIVEMAGRDEQMKKLLPAITSTVDFLKTSKRGKEEVIRSYTEDGLYYIFNQYVRYGDYLGLKLFREYIFCLKGSLSELGVPMNSKITVYRGMAIPKSVIDQWAKGINDFGLFSAFTSTSKSRSSVENFIRPKAEQCGVLMTIELTDSIQEFADYLAKFDFIEDCGVFYPTNIAKYSKYEVEEEVLFPPFYPFKVVSVAEEGARWNIKLVVPTHVCLATNKEFQNKSLKFNMFRGKPEEYIKKLCELVRAGLSDDLCFWQKNVVSLGLLPAVLSALESTQPMRRFALEFENDRGGALSESAFKLIVDRLLEHSADSLTHISFSGCRLSPACIIYLTQRLTQFGKLSILELAFIEENLVAALAPVVGKLSGLSALELSWNLSMGPGGAELLAPELRKLPALTELRLLGCALGPKGAAAFFPVVETFSGQLTALDMGGDILTNNMITEAGMQALAPGLVKAKSLVSLNLSYNFLGEKGAIALGSVLPGLVALKKLNLSNNMLGAKGGAGVAAGLRTLKSLAVLEMDSNMLEAEGTIALAPAIGDLKELVTLKFSDNMIKSAGTAALVPALKRLKHLNELFLGVNFMGTEGAVALVPAIRELKSLTTLYLGGNMIEGEGTAALAPALRELTLLTALFFEANKLGIKGAAAFATVLPGLKLLRCLKLGGNSLGPEEAAALADGIGRLEALEDISFDFNNLGSKGMIALAPAMKRLKALTRLGLCDNGIGPEGGQALAEAVQDLQSLIDFDVSNNPLGIEGATALMEVIKEYKGLSTFNIGGCKVGFKELSAKMPEIAGMKAKIPSDDDIPRDCCFNAQGELGAKY